MTLVACLDSINDDQLLEGLSRMFGGTKPCANGCGRTTLLTICGGCVRMRDQGRYARYNAKRRSR